MSIVATFVFIFPFYLMAKHFTGYVVCPAEKRFLMLFSFLKRNRKKKIMVFFSSCLSVKFHHELLNYIDMPVMSIHVRIESYSFGLHNLLTIINSQGKQKQTKRTTTFFQFCNAETGILLCTDVAARGLDIPAVDWIVQYDPPDDPKVDKLLKLFAFHYSYQFVIRNIFTE